MFDYKYNVRSGLDVGWPYSKMRLDFTAYTSYSLEKARLIEILAGRNGSSAQPTKSIKFR